MIIHRADEVESETPGVWVFQEIRAMMYDTSDNCDIYFTLVFRVVLVVLDQKGSAVILVRRASWVNEEIVAK